MKLRNLLSAAAIAASTASVMAQTAVVIPEEIPPVPPSALTPDEQKTQALSFAFNDCMRVKILPMLKITGELIQRDPDVIQSVIRQIGEAHNLPQEKVENVTSSTLAGLSSGDLNATQHAIQSLNMFLAFYQCRDTLHIGDAYDNEQKALFDKYGLGAFKRPSKTENQAENRRGLDA